MASEAFYHVSARSVRDDQPPETSSFTELLLARGRSIGGSTPDARDAKWELSYDQLLAGSLLRLHERSARFLAASAERAMQSKALRDEMLRLMLHAKEALRVPPEPRPVQHSTVLALSRTLRAGSAGAAACAAASLTAAARGALPRQDEGMVLFRSNKGMGS